MLHLQAELAGTEDLRSGLNLSLDDSTQVISEATHHGSSPVASLLPKRGVQLWRARLLPILVCQGSRPVENQWVFTVEFSRIHWASQDPPVLLCRCFFFYFASESSGCLQNLFANHWSCLQIDTQIQGFYRTSKWTTWKSWLSLFFMEGSGNIRVIAGNPWHTVCCIYILFIIHTILNILYTVIDLRLFQGCASQHWQKRCLDKKPATVSGCFEWHHILGFLVGAPDGQMVPGWS
jgi:hypothetical protein